ncbi:MAG: radical SAM family heme chaperone HemW [Phycisphaerae bacterium]
MKNAVLTTPSPRALYAHVPFCQTICGYCDFYSQVLDKPAVGPLVDALLAELALHRAAGPIEVDTIFVGGGTPTTLPTAELRRLLDALHRLAADPRTLEFTVEANPATVSDEIAAALVASGVNRVSIGAQSFDTAELRVLDRLHAPPQVGATLDACRRAGVRQINLDLIFAIPGQSLDGWRRNLQAAIELRPEHLSCYALTYEPGTPLYERLRAGGVQRAENELEATMYETAIADLAAAGYEQYEISNFARPGCQCRHNLAYWHNEPHVSIGPSAAGLVNGERYKNVPDTAAYVRAVRAGRSPRVESERLPLERQARETAMLELRLNAGIERTRFERRYGRDPADLFAGEFAPHVELNLLEVTPTHVRLTPRGRLVADAIIVDLL